jgi:hypothetical protein
VAELYGKSHVETETGDYESPEEYADQGDKRKVRFLTFRYFTQEVDPAGNESLMPHEVDRDEEVTVEQIGLVALQQGERDGAFYTSEQLKNLEASGSEAPISEQSINEMGEHELSEWITENKPSVNDVLEKVGTDKDLANRMLAAENIATDGDPRSSLVAGLTKIIEAE